MKLLPYLLVIPILCSWQIGRVCADPSVIGPDTLLAQEADPSSLPVLSDHTTSLQSSYDRTGGNSDSGNYLSVGNGVGVVADMDGPGAIVRLWSANPDSRIKIYIDGSPTPTVDMDFNKMFNASTAPFLPPLSRNSSGGNICYIPITYAKHCRVTLDNAPGLYYQVNYVTFKPGTQVRSFTLPLPASDQTALDATQAAWSALAPPATLPGLTTTRTLNAGATLNLASYKGPGVLQHIRMALPDATDAQLRSIVLRAYFDGHTAPDIEAPVADFFGNSYGRKPIGTLLMTTAADGAFQANFPMPFAHSAVFTLESGLKAPVSVAWDADLIHKPFNASNTGYFHTTWSQEITKYGFPHIWARITAERGKFVGIVQTMNGLGLGYLEGDDQVRVDDQSWNKCQVTSTVIGPWNGTGTEDCFNCGWYFGGGPITTPTHGAQVRTDAGEINCFRWYLNDAPIFQSSLDAQIEHGGANDAPGTYYSSVAYWYSNGPAEGVGTFPAASSLTVPRLPLMPAYPNAIEGESLVNGSKATVGGVGPQGMSSFGPDWSDGAQLFWTAHDPNGVLTLTFTPPAAGTYDLVGYFTKAGDYGQVTFAVNGKAVGGTFDGFNNGVIPSGPVDLGNVTLPAGPSTLVVTNVGKNAAASNYLFGLDALCLNTPGTAPATALVAPAQ